MNQTLSPAFSPSSKYLEVCQDKASCLSDRSHISERPPSSAKSINYTNVFNFHLKKPRKFPKLTPAHSQSFYRRFRGQSRFGRLFSTKNRFYSSDRKLGNLIRRSESANRMREDQFSEQDANRTFQVIQEKLTLNSNSKLRSPKPEKRSRNSLKHPKSLKEIRKSLMKNLKNQSISLIPQKNMSPDFVKIFTLEFAGVLNETDFSASGMINYSKFCIILSKLKFFSSPFKKSEEETQLLLRAWKLLGGYEGSFISTTEVYLFSLFILNVFFRLESPLPNSPQNRKKGLTSLKAKELSKLRVEFLCFHHNRSEAKAAVDSVTEEAPSCSECFQSISVIKDPVERFDVMPNEFFFNESPNKQIIRKVSLKDLALMNKSGATSWQITIDSTKNVSCNDSEEFVPDQVGSPLKDRISVAKVQIKRHSTKIDDINKSNLDLNQSLRSSSKCRLDLTFTDSQEIRGDSGFALKFKGIEKTKSEVSLPKK